jgi:acetyl esterase/lipase
MLDPELAEAAIAFSFDGVPTPEEVPALRHDLPELGSTDLVERTDLLVPGEPPVPVRIHRAPGSSDRSRPGVLSIHGGGYIIGGPSMDDAMFERWCPTAGVVGISVDYRLAPEHPYPGALDDCDRALAWVIDHAEDLDIDPDRLGVYGASAGGGLAAGLALRLRDRGGPRLAFVLLEAPMLDDRRSTPSSRLPGLAIWSRETNSLGWRCYLGDRFGADVPAEAAPARATDLTGLPPTFVAVGAVDGFRDEDIDFATRLSQAGVPTELHVYPGAPHGFQLFDTTVVARQARRDRDEWLHRQLNTSP